MIVAAFGALALSYERIWIDRRVWFRLHGNGVHLLPLAIVFFGSLGLLATFAPPATLLPSARVGRHEPLLPRLGAFARTLLLHLNDSRDAVIGATVLGTAITGLATLRFADPVATLAGAVYLALAALVFRTCVWRQPGA
jgi:hypothetical protein